MKQNERRVREPPDFRSVCEREGGKEMKGEGIERKVLMEGNDLPSSKYANLQKAGSKVQCKNKTNLSEKSRFLTKEVNGTSVKTTLIDVGLESSNVDNFFFFLVM